jgi:hypothetical protein
MGGLLFWAEQLRHHCGHMGQLEFLRRKYPSWHSEQEVELSQEVQ